MLLELAQVSVHYGSLVALDRVSLGINAGEIVVIMGPNGAGKSTVLKAILGLAPIVSGTVYWKQKPLSAAPHELVNLGISLVPQGKRVFANLTIEENLEIGCLSLKDDEKRRRMDSIMELFPVLHKKRHHLASQMSGGEQQMVALGRGLMTNPEILLLDEPTLGLAPLVVKEVFQRIIEVNKKMDISILLVEHNIRSALDIATRAYILDKGVVVHAGTPTSVRESDILSQVFLGKVSSPHFSYPCQGNSIAFEGGSNRHGESPLQMPS